MVFIELTIIGRGKSLFNVNDITGFIADSEYTTSINMRGEGDLGVYRVRESVTEIKELMTQGDHMDNHTHQNVKVYRQIGTQYSVLD